MGTSTKKVDKKLLNYVGLLVVVFAWLFFGYKFLLKGLIPFPSDYLVDFFPPWNAYYANPVKNNAMPDIITQIYPWKKLTIDSWLSGEIPAWNPYQFSGTPHLANVQSSVFSITNILFFVLPFITAWSWHILLQPLLAGAFMFFFISTITRSGLAAITSAISFMFSGYYMN